MLIERRCALDQLVDFFFFFDFLYMPPPGFSSRASCINCGVVDSDDFFFFFFDFLYKIGRAHV